MKQICFHVAGVPGSSTCIMLEKHLTTIALRGKIIETIIKEEKRPILPETVELYLARLNGEWLGSQDSRVKELLAGEIPEDILTILSGDEIDLDATIGNVFAEAPQEDVIHVLAKLPDKLTLRIAKARRKCVLGNDDWQSAIWGVHTYSAGDQHFWLEKEDTDEAGLTDRRLKLYCRAAFHEEFKFLQEKVCDEGHLGWIVGPPGTGKSVTAMAFATTVDRSKWMVTWVNVRKGSKLCRCVRLIGDKRKTKVIESKGLLEVLEAEEDDARLHLVIVDGWALGINETLSTKCEEWIMRKDKKERRRLVFVCSMSSRGSLQAQYEVMTRAQEFTVFSWTLDEYHAAVQDDDVFGSVMENLDADDTLLDAVQLPRDSVAATPDKTRIEQRAAMVEAKYHYAGGSCRHMFFFKTQEVYDIIERAIETVETSLFSIDLLRSLFPGPDSSEARVMPVVSRYSALRIAVKCYADSIRILKSSYGYHSNPVLGGWMLEMAFFSSLRNGSLTLLTNTGESWWSWGPCHVSVEDDIPRRIHDKPMWIMPSRRTKSSYDVVMLCKRERHVRFIQVVSGESIDLRPDCYHAWLQKLTESSDGFVAAKLEIVVIGAKSRLRNLQSGFGFQQELPLAFGGEWEVNDVVARVKLVQGEVVDKRSESGDARTTRKRRKLG